PKGKPTVRLVVQMHGKHGYRRVDAQKALVRGLAGKLPASWQQVEENAAVEIWLTIEGATAVCGVRLSDRTMRHRWYKVAHMPASLRPTVAAAMVRLADIRPGQRILDPMCGAGTILAETFLGSQSGVGRANLHIRGGDLDQHAWRAARATLARRGEPPLIRWDARRLPLANETVDRVICNLPFGVKLEKPEDIPQLYRRVLPELNRLLRPGGRAVLLAADINAIQGVVRKLPWKTVRQVQVRVLGQRASIFVFQKLS